MVRLYTLLATRQANEAQTLGKLTCYSRFKLALNSAEII